MTDTRKIAKARATGGGIVASVAAAVLTLLFIIDAGGTRDAVLSSLRLSATSVIPAVFPCAVLSGLIVRLGGADKLGRLAERPMRLLFALPGEAFCAIFLGFLCGFPVGAKTCTELFDRGSLSREEAERLLAFSSLASPSFVINAVGKGMLGSAKAGVILFTALVLISLVSGTLLSLTARKGHKYLTTFAQPAKERESFSEALIGSVNSAADAMVRLCAFSAFFSAIPAVLLPLSATLPDAVRAAVAGLFELSGGCAAAASCSLPLPSVAAVLGWTGLAVHFQILSVIKGKLSSKRYFFVSLIRAVSIFFVLLFVSIPLSDI